MNCAVDDGVGKIADPLILVVQGSGPEHDRAIVEIMLQGSRQLPADVGRILRSSDAVAFAVKAADAAVPSLGQLAALERIHAFHRPPPPPPPAAHPTGPRG